MALCCSIPGLQVDNLKELAFVPVMIVSIARRGVKASGSGSSCEKHQARLSVLRNPSTMQEACHSSGQSRCSARIDAMIDCRDQVRRLDGWWRYSGGSTDFSPSVTADGSRQAAAPRLVIVLAVSLLVKRFLLRRAPRKSRGLAGVSAAVRSSACSRYLRRRRSPLPTYRHIGSGGITWLLMAQPKVPLVSPSGYCARR